MQMPPMKIVQIFMGDILFLVPSKTSTLQMFIYIYIWLNLTRTQIQIELIFDSRNPDWKLAKL